MTQFWFEPSEKSSDQFEVWRRTSTASEIRDYLRHYGQTDVSPWAAALVEDGIEFGPRPLPDQRWRRSSGSHVPTYECVINAQKAALEHRDWHYVEGAAIRDGEVGFQPHAWNVDQAGSMIDTTWNDGVAYLGVVIVKRAILGRGAGSLYQPVIPLLHRDVTPRPSSPQPRRRHDELEPSIHPEPPGGAYR